MSLWSKDGNFQNIISNLGLNHFKNYFDVYVFGTLFYQYLCPLAYLTFTYTKMSFKLWKNPTPGIGNEEITKTKSIKMMVSIVAVFAICWLPYQIFSTLKVLWIDFNK